MKKQKVNYLTKSIRIAEDTWGNLREAKKRSGKSWNLFMAGLLDKKGSKRPGQYKHMDGSLCCNKCNLTVEEGCPHN